MMRFRLRANGCSRTAISLLPPRGPRQQQIGHIGAGNQQDKAHRAQQNHERPSRRRLRRVAQGWRSEASLRVPVIFGVLPAGLCSATALFPALSWSRVTPGLIARPHRNSGPRWCCWDRAGRAPRGRPGDRWRRTCPKHSDDRVRLVAERNGAIPTILGIAAELALPEAVADHDNLAAVGAVLLLREGAAKQDGRAKKDGSTPRRRGCRGPVREQSPVRIEARTTEVVSGHILKDTGLALSRC